MNRALLEYLRTETRNLQEAGLFREELVVVPAPRGTLAVGGRELLDLCSTDSLGLSNHPEVKQAAKSAIEAYGAGLAAQRAFTGTLYLHAELERAVSTFLGTEETLVYASGYHAATGVFESLLTEKDHLFCDEQSQAAIADGIRLSRARVFQYRTRHSGDLEEHLRRSRSGRFRTLVTDGVFPLEGAIAPLADICLLARRYDAMVVVEDSHGVGVLGATGRGTAEHVGVHGDVDLVVGSFGHALGGGAGGYVSGRKEIVSWLRQTSRPHLTTTALSPGAVAAAHKAIELASSEGAALRTKVLALTRMFRETLVAQGFRVLGGEHPTLAIMVGDAVQTQRMCDGLLRRGIFAVGFCHPIVPERSARIRLNVTVKHMEEALGAAAVTFGAVAREIKLKLKG